MTRAPGCWPEQHFFFDSQARTCEDTVDGTVLVLDMAQKSRLLFTHVSDVMSHSLALDQRRHPKAVVPVSAAEQQFSIVGDNKQSCCYLHPGGEGSGQKPLSSGGDGGRKQPTQREEESWRAESDTS